MVNFLIKLSSIFLLVVVVAFNIKAQTTFTDRSSSLPLNNFYGWFQKGVADMNADGRDDIVRADRDGNFFILRQQPNGNFIEQALGSVQPFTPLSVILADVDNNGCKPRRRHWLLRCERRCIRRL